ncbi:protein ANTAGONIST OF LIKE HETEROCHROMATIN PROTEIN 1-like [Mizuhopecten yessoensis]|uniref:protein ANTAGONIST OF LIKE HETEROCHROMATIN PROTEIN 1-like n=1 Tax=Mizuhopecten yessoensis TaxID=6573 RepID=UPI000B45815D|nr:protein ANTAGONIST OF LIKE HETEROCHROMATIN PROTEIN 1-like [Mizuhopecten yessoensis]
MILPENVDDFKTHYRLSRNMFDCLLERVRDDLIKDFHGGRNPINPDKQLLVFLNYIGNQQSMRECAHIFGLSKSTVHSVVASVADAIVKLHSQVIRWPDADRQREIAREVEDSVGISGVVGFIDGTHIRLASAPGGEQDYYNRKSFPSIQLQAVVDNNMTITNAYCGWPGCTHDARVLRNSELFSKAENGTLFLQDHFLLADNAYPLRNWLISPFKNYGNLSPQQKRFNKKVSSARQTVERSFSHLKGRFRRLKEVTFHNPTQITKLVISACVLHNLCVIHRDDLDEYMDEGNDDDPGNDEAYEHGHHGILRRTRLLQLV